MPQEFNRIVKSFPLADHIVCLDESTGHIRVFNQVAASMLALVQEGLSEEAMVQSIVRDYEVDVATATADVHKFLQVLNSPDTALLEELEVYIPDTSFQPLRRGEWVERTQLNLPGYRLEVFSELPGLCHLLSEMFVLTPSSIEPVHTISLNIYKNGECYPVVSDGQTLDTGVTLADTAIKCLREINGLVARSREWSIIFHASAVARGDAAVLMPALGGSGKTTLAAYLMHRGFAYLNDDAVPLLARSSELLPIPVSLSIKEGSWPVLGHYFAGLENIRFYGPIGRRMKYLPPVDAQVQQTPVSCQVLIIPVYDESRQGAQVLRLSEVDVFARIIQSGCIIEQPIQPDMLQALISWLDGMPCYQLAYSSLDGLETVVSGLLDDALSDGCG